MSSTHTSIHFVELSVRNPKTIKETSNPELIKIASAAASGIYTTGMYAVKPENMIQDIPEYAILIRLGGPMGGFS